MDAIRIRALRVKHLQLRARAKHYKRVVRWLVEGLTRK